MNDRLWEECIVPLTPQQFREAHFHVLNHGTDHRAQILAALAALGVTTFPQDFAPLRPKFTLIQKCQAFWKCLAP
jgi:uncharacterized damage-inducible protein DinB